MGSLANVSILKGPTKALRPALLNKMFEDIATKDEIKDRTAIIFEDPESESTISHTYTALNRQTNAISRAISKLIQDSHRNPDGDFIVAVRLAPSDNLVATLLAIWKCGAAYLPLDVSFPSSRVEHIIKESRPQLVITENDFDFPNLCRHIRFNDLLESAKLVGDAPMTASEIVRHRQGNLAIVIYTSGSTGVPKGVRLPHEVILNRLQWQWQTFPYEKDEKNCIFKTALTFVDSICELWGPLLNGLSVIIIPKKVTQDPEKFVQKLEEYKIYRLVLVPSLLQSILLYFDMQKPVQNPLSYLRLWVCSGEPLPVSLAQDFLKRFPDTQKLCNFYGSTEIMADVTYYTMENPDQLLDKTKVPIGVPVDNTLIYLLDQDMRPVELGATGELWVSGLNLAAGYVNGRDPDRFVTNPLNPLPQYSRLYRTGDYAKIEKGNVIYEGRTDSQVKVRGHRLDLSEVERATSLLQDVDKAIVLCYHPAQEDQAILVFVTLKKGHLVTEMQLEDTLAEKIPAYMLPQVIIIETVPLLVNGKIDRQMLLKSYENTNNNDDKSVQVEIDLTGVPPSQMKQGRALLETVASVLGRSARSVIKIDANFYDIGGNSLNSIVTITKLCEMGYYISISDFIGAKNLKEVLEHVSKDQNIMTTRPPESEQYFCVMLKNEHKMDVFDMITTSFYQKADLEQWLFPDIHERDYPELLEAMWPALVAQGLSFIARRHTDQKPVGVALNLDAYDEPEIEITSKLGIIFEFLDFLEIPIKKSRLPVGKGKIVHCSMMGTHSSLCAKENVAVMQKMEEEVIRLANLKNYIGVLTVNTNPLTQQFGKDVYEYQVLLDYQVNQYQATDGTKPFGKAPDDQRAMVCWKTI